MKYCDQCGATIQQDEFVRPSLVRAALYKCGRCGAVLSNEDGTTFCDNCGSRFRLVTECPNHHSLQDLAASFCSDCGERIARDRLPPLRLAPVVRERFNVMPRPAPTISPPLVEPRDDGLGSRLSGVYGSIRRHIQKPRVRIIQNTDAQSRARVLYPQTLQQQMYPQMAQPMPYPNQMYPQMQPQMMYPNFMYPGQQRLPTVYPQGFHPPNRIVHPQGAQMQGWPFRDWTGRNQ